MPLDLDLKSDGEDSADCNNRCEHTEALESGSNRNSAYDIRRYKKLEA